MGNLKIGTGTEIFFGNNAREKLAPYITQANIKRTLVVASTSSLKRERVANMVEAIQKASTTHIWHKVSPNPRIVDVNDCAKEFRNQQIDCIVGVGGGSAMDQAKATAMALSTKLDIQSLLGVKAGLPERQNLLILAPTTSGTGAELSYGAILSDTQKTEKLGLRGQSLAADVAFVDPELTYTLPKRETVTTGFDVLTHALETYISHAATNFTADLSRGAVARVFKNLTILSEDIEHRIAREELAYASMMMGVNLALSTTCLPHRLQYPLGAATDTAHAAGLAALYPAWLHHLKNSAGPKLAQCCHWIGAGSESKKDSYNASTFIEEIQNLQREIQLVPTLQELGVCQESLKRFAGEVKGNMNNDPCFRGSETISSIYEHAWHNSIP